MEHYRISKLLNDSTVSKFVTRKWIEVNDLSSSQDSVNKNTKFKTSMLKSHLCDYSDAYIVVKGTIDLLLYVANEKDKVQKNVTSKNNAPFRSCISKVKSTLIDNAEDLNIVMSMYNLSEYSKNYSMTSGSLWNYYRDEIGDVDDNASDGKSFNYKTKIVGKTRRRPERPPRLPQQPPNSDESQLPRPERPPQPPVPDLNVEVTIPFKYLGNVWKFLNLPLIK